MESISNIKNYSLLNTNINTMTKDNLNQMADLSMVSNYDHQLTNIAQEIKSSIDVKKQYREEISILKKLNQEQVIQHLGENYVSISKSQKNKIQNFFPELKINFFNDQDLVHKDKINSLIENRENLLFNHNEQSEFQIIQMQSLMDQRKIAISLISQISGSFFDTAKNITSKF